MPPKKDQQKAAANGKAGTEKPKAPLQQLPHLTLGTTGTGLHAARKDLDPVRDDDPSGSAALQAALSMLGGDADDDPEDQREYETLRNVLENVMKNKREKQAKKAQALIAELQDSMLREVQALEDAAGRDRKQLASSMQSTFTTAKKKLKEKFKVIEDLTAKYEQDINAAWADYVSYFQKLEGTANKLLEEQLGKTRSAQKRKVSELSTQLEAKLVDTDRKVAKITAKAGKASEVTGVLSHFMQSAA